MNIQKRAFQYLFSLITVTTVLVYGLNLPSYITNNKTLVKEYYDTNYFQNFLLDIVLIAIYLGIAYKMMQQFNITDILGQLFTVVFVTLAISGFFYLYFILTPKSSSFFSRWFHTVKHNAVIYDILLVGSVFMVDKLCWNNFS